MTSPHRFLFLSCSTLAAIWAGGCRTDFGYLSEGSSAAGMGASSAEAGTGSDSGGASAGAAGAAAGDSLGGAGDGGAEPGGAAGAAGEAGMTAGEPRTALESAGGDIAPDSNDFGIDGEWRVFGADADLLVPNFSGSKVCLKGTVLGVKNGDFNRYWGGGLQLVLHTAEPGAAGLPYDAEAAGLAGLMFVIEGAKVPSTIRLKFKMIGTNDSYCLNVPAKSGNELTLNVKDTQHNCWVSGGEPADGKTLENFEIHFVPESSSDIPLDFCVTAMQVVPAASP
jgi:hypothetical protein